MLDLLREAFATVNLPFTILLIAVLLYWIAVILGLADLEGIDSALSADVNVPDANVEGDSGDATGLEGWAILRFFHIGEVPIMLVASVLVLSVWVISILGNYYLNPGHSLLLGLALLVPNLFVSGLLTRAVTSPFRRVFKYLNQDAEKHLPIVGRTCVISTSTVDHSFGQATVDGSGAPIIINARTPHAEVLRKGDAAIIFAHDEEKNTYLVRKIETTVPLP